MTRPRGATLVELLVGLFLASIFLTLLYQLLVLSYRTGNEEIVRASAEQSLLVVGNLLQADLKSTTPGGISLSSEGSQVAVHPIDTVTEGGRLVYQERLWLWRFDAQSGVLKRTEIGEIAGHPFDGLALRLSPNELSALPAGSRLSRSLMGVKSFTVENPLGTQAPLVGSPIRVSVVLSLPEARTRREVSYRAAVHVRSGGL